MTAAQMAEHLAALAEPLASQSRNPEFYTILIGKLAARATPAALAEAIFEHHDHLAVLAEVERLRRGTLTEAQALLTREATHA